MARFFGLSVRESARSELSFADFVEIVQGATVRSCASGDDFVELGLTEEINVRFQSGPGEQVDVFLMSTLNEGDIPPMRIRIVESDQPITAELVEDRLHQLRQSYAITFMIRQGRSGELKSAIIRNPKVDLESKFIPAKEKLYISSAAPGSFWVTVLAKSDKAWAALKLSLTLPYKEGRNALLRRVEAETQLKELAVDEKRVEVGLKRLRGAVTAINDIEKIKDEEMKAAMKKAFSSNIGELGTQGLLEPPRDGR